MTVLLAIFDRSVCVQNVARAGTSGRFEGSVWRGNRRTRGFWSASRHALRHFNVAGYTSNSDRDTARAEEEKDELVQEKKLEEEKELEEEFEEELSSLSSLHMLTDL